MNKKIHTTLVALILWTFSAVGFADPPPLLTGVEGPEAGDGGVVPLNPGTPAGSGVETVRASERVQIKNRRG
jgi:hypothetical protein